MTFFVHYRSRQLFCAVSPAELDLRYQARTDNIYNGKTRIFQMKEVFDLSQALFVYGIIASALKVRLTLSIDSYFFQAPVLLGALSALAGWTTVHDSFANARLVPLSSFPTVFDVLSPADQRAHNHHAIHLRLEVPRDATYSRRQAKDNEVASEYRTTKVILHRSEPVMPSHRLQANLYHEELARQWARGLERRPTGQ